MGYSRYIGRVGALAVALGIGVALANGPATAWADDDDGSSSGSPSSTSDSSAGADSTSETSGAAGSTGASGDASTGNASVGADGGEDDAAKEDADDDESTDAAKSGADDAAARKDSTSAAGQPAAVRKGSRVSQRESVTPRKSEVKVRSEAAPSAKRSPAATVSNTPTTAAGGTAPPAVSVSDKRQSVKISTPVRSADVVDVSAVSTTPPEPAKTVTTAVLSALGLSPLATGGPTDVPESPVAWATFAALRRQTDEDAGTEQKLLSVADPVASTLSVEDEPQPMMAMAAVVGAPVLPVVGSPDQVSGAVLVGLNPVGPGGNPLTYAVTSAPVNGTVAVAGASVTYTPTVAARLAAGSTGSVDFDSFTVSDGQTSTSVSVPVLPAVWVNAPQVSNVTGASPYGVALVGNTAYVANQGTNTVSVINTLTGQTVRSPIVVGSAPTGVAASPDGAYVYVANRTSGTVSVIRTSNNTVVDINPGTTAIDSIKVGAQPEMIAVNTSAITTPTGVIAKGARLYVSNYGSGTVSVIDVSNPLAPKLVDTNTATPTTIDAIKVGTNPRGIAFAQTANGPRLYVANRGSGSVSVIDAVTNKALDTNPATTTTVDAIKVGSTPQQIAISPDGKTAYVTNYGSNTVSIINTVTNKVVDANPTTTAVDAVAVRSNPNGVAVSADGTLVYVANGDDRISVIDTKTKTVVNTLRIDTQTENNAHVLAVRADGSLMVTDFADRALRRVTYQRGNTAPVALATPTVEEPNATGVVSGLINLKDWDGDLLSYTTASAPTRGSVSFDPAAGTYTYTPTQAARDAAAQNPGLTDTFTIRATEDRPAGASVTTSLVTVSVLPTPPPPVDPDNHAPVATPTVFSQDPLTGAVTGTVRISDADGDPLGFTAVGAPVHGRVSFNWSTGAFAYTPSHAARLSADQTAGPDTDSFTVTVGDGETTTTTVVTVPLSPAKLTQNPTVIPVGVGVAGIVIPGGYAVVVNQATGMVTVIDTATNTVKGTVPAGAGATSVASTWNNTFAYVALKDENAVSVINTWSITGEKWIPVGPQPWGIVAAPNYQHVYVTNSGSNYVSIIDTYSKTVVGAIAVGNNPMGAAISADSTRLYVANRGSSTLSIVDTPSRSVVATVPVGANPIAVTLNSAGTRAYVSNLTGTISVVDISVPTPTVVATVAVGPEPYSMALSPDGTLYVVNRNDTMSVIDTSTNTVVRTVTMDTAAENGLHFVAVDPYGRVYVTDASDGVVRSFIGAPSASTAIPTTSTATQVGSNPSLVAVNGNRAYVLNSGSQTISVVDTTTKQVTATIPVSATALGVAVAPNGQHLYVADYDSVSVINTSTRQVVSDVVIPDLCAGVCYGSTVGLTDLAISPNGERVYVIQAYATDIGPWASVAVIQTSDNSLIYNEMSAYVTDLEYTSDGSRLFYTQGDYRFVHVSDFSLGQTPVIEVSTPDSGWAVPLAIAVRPDGLRAYVVVDSEMFDSLGAKYVAVIDTDRSSPTYNTVIGHFSAPYGAQDVAVSADGRRLYISLADGKTVEVIDTSTNAVLGYFTKPGAGAMAVGPDGTLYFTDPATGRMHAVTTGAPPVV